MKYLNQILQRYRNLFIIAIFVIALAMRLAYIQGGNITFGYDQARDAFNAQQIISGHLKILGPPSSTPGLFHGVFYYYVLVLAYIFGGNPVNASILIAVINAAVVFVIYLLGYKFTKKPLVGLAAALIYAFSYEANQYAIWLSNPTLGMFTVPLMYLSLYMWLFDKEKNVFKKISSAICGISLALSVQSEIFLFYHAAIVLLWLIIKRKNILKKDFLVFAVCFTIFISSMIVSEIKFGFKGIGGVQKLLTTQDAIIATKGLGDVLILFLNQLGKSFAYSSYPLNIGYGGGAVLIAVVVSFYYWKKRSLEWGMFLSSWIFSHILVVSMGGTSTPFLLVGLAPAICVFLGYGINYIYNANLKLLSLGILAIIIVSNLIMNVKNLNNGSVIFSIQKDMLLKNEISVLDYTYKVSNGAPFSVSTLTSPLFVNTTWSYLYNWYGKEKYGYLPYWIGHDQIGQLGNNLANSPKDVKLHYFISEPTNGIIDVWINYAYGDQNSMSQLVDKKAFGDLSVEKRLMK